MMRSEIDNVASHVSRLMISCKPKRRAHSRSETEIINLEDIEKYNVNRGHISKWAADALPLEYLPPHRATKWYLPLFCLWVALSPKETEDFARHLRLPIDRNGSIHCYSISECLSDLCGADPQVMPKRYDRGEGWGDWTWVFSLTTNYDIVDGADVNEPLRKYREIVEEAFGSSKEVAWWLEYTANRSPSHWQWRKHRLEWIDGRDPEWTYDEREPEYLFSLVWHPVLAIY